jgi:hypothetical protein
MPTCCWDKFIDSILSVTSATQVHLVGHSAGGGRGYSYLNDPTQAAKVISYAHIGQQYPKRTRRPGRFGAYPQHLFHRRQGGQRGRYPGAENVVFSTFDHYQVATSAETFAAMYAFFYGAAPQTTQIVPTDAITIGANA